MRVVVKLFRPLKKAVVAFFSHDLAVRRGRDGYKVVLQARAASGPSAPGSREQARLVKENAELQLMLQELDELLDRQPGPAQTLRYIHHVRQALHKKGLRALHKVPVDVLQRALNQFETLVSNWSPAGLANLRSKMAVALIDREYINPEAEADAYRTAALIDSLPAVPSLPEVEVASDDDALAAAYAALAHAPAAGPVDMQSELGARSAKAVATNHTRQAADAPLELRVLEH